MAWKVTAGATPFPLTGLAEELAVLADDPAGRSARGPGKLKNDNSLSAVLSPGGPGARLVLGSRRLTQLLPLPPSVEPVRCCSGEVSPVDSLYELTDWLLLCRTKWQRKKSADLTTVLRSNVTGMLGNLNIYVCMWADGNQTKFLFVHFCWQNMCW